MTLNKENHVLNMLYITYKVIFFEKNNILLLNPVVKGRGLHRESVPRGRTYGPIQLRQKKLPAFKSAGVLTRRNKSVVKSVACGLEGPRGKGKELQQWLRRTPLNTTCLFIATVPTPSLRQPQCLSSSIASFRSCILSCQDTNNSGIYQDNRESAIGMSDSSYSTRLTRVAFLRSRACLILGTGRAEYFILTPRLLLVLTCLFRRSPKRAQDAVGRLTVLRDRTKVI